MSAPAALAHSPRDVLRFPRHQALLFDGLIGFFELTGLWRYPQPASGDLEDMRLLDKVYWVYKAGKPVRHATKGSGLEAYFAGQDPFAWTPPEGFAPTAQLSVTAVGDLMSHPYLTGSAETLYRDVADLIFGADVSMANLECVVLSDSVDLEIGLGSGPPLVMDRDAFQVVSGHGASRYDFLATACNHSLDFGEAGVASTIGAARDRGIAFHGVNEREVDAEQATVIERNGFRIAVLAHTFGLNGYRPPEHRPRIVNRTDLNRVDRLDLSLLEAQLRHCERAEADFVVAQLHWGMEFEFFPRPEQLEVARRIAELGVDAIVGHHPHVLQPVEYYRTRRDPARVVPIFYSLGNLTNPFTAPYMCRSGIARMELVKGTSDDGPATYVRDARVVAVDQWADTARRELSLRPAKLAPRRGAAARR